MKKILAHIFLLTVVFVQAQDGGTLKPEDVIKLTIENNFDIQIAKNNTQIAKNSNNIGLVGGAGSTGGTPQSGSGGMLPQISLVATPSMSNNNIVQKYSNGTEINRNGVASSNVSAAINVTWYFFDGLKMFATKKKLNRNEELSNLQFKQTLENTLLNALTSYYQMISIQQYIKSLQVSLEIAAEQKKLAEDKLKSGIGSNVDVLQTQVDFNNIQVQILQQQNLLNEQRVNLNNIFKRPAETNIDVPDTIIIQTKPEYDIAGKNLETGNSGILIGAKNVEISELVLKEYKANRLPRLGVIGNYALSRNQNQAGFSLLNQNLGYTLGLTASWNLLNNLATHTAVKNQLVQLSSDKLKLDAAKLQERANLYKAYYNFQNNLSVIEIEKQSAGYVKQNLDIAAQRYKLGLSNYIEYRTVEQSYETTTYRLSQAAFNAKISELNYLKAQGLLVH
ncbi:MAG: TolC family protein [Bacteroidia bacterium]